MEPPARGPGATRLEPGEGTPKGLPRLADLVALLGRTAGFLALYALLFAAGAVD